MNIRAMTAALCALLPVAGWCEDAAAPPPPQQEWTGKGQAGYLSSQGNSEAKSVNAALDAGYLDGPWKHAFHLGGLYGESAGIVSAERWDTAWQTDYALTHDVYTFGGLRYQHDLFNGFAYQASVSAGVGYEVFKTKATTLDVQVGVGYKELRPEELTKAPDGAVIGRQLEAKEGEAIGTLGVNLLAGAHGDDDADGQAVGGERIAGHAGDECAGAGGEGVDEAGVVGGLCTAGQHESAARAAEAGPAGDAESGVFVLTFKDRYLRERGRRWDYWTVYWAAWWVGRW